MIREDIICPGETIKEMLEIYHYTQKDLADKLEMDLKTVNEILNGKAPITVDTAIKLEMIFNIDAIFWNNLEFNYRKELKEVEEQEKMQEEYNQIKLIYKEMVKREIVPETRDKNEIVKNFKKFMEITSISNLEQEYNKVACRQAIVKKFNMLNLMVWIQIGLKKAREVKTEEYNKEIVLREITNIRKLTLMEDQTKAREELKKICSKCGIIINFEKSMPNTAIYGIAKWLDSNTPFIQVSDRGKNVATFWFTFMHELGHIVNGRKKICFLDMEKNEIENDEDKQFLKEIEEVKANYFSRNSFIPDKEYKKFIQTLEDKEIEEKDIINFARYLKIAPCIVAGRIKFEQKKYDDKVLNSFTIKMEF